MNPTYRISRSIRVGAVVVVTAAGLAACSSSSPSGTSTSSTSGVGGGSSQVLPVKTNPITNTSTAQTLKIASVVVENNVDASGKAASDHLEIALMNTGSTPLSKFEVFYTFTDPTTKATESYDAKLPGSFTIAPGKTRIAHFDESGLSDHFAVNKFSLYSTSKNALTVKVVVSADGAAVQTATVKKAKGGPEQAD